MAASSSSSPSPTVIALLPLLLPVFLTAAAAAGRRCCGRLAAAFLLLLLLTAAAGASPNIPRSTVWKAPADASNKATYGGWQGRNGRQNPCLLACAGGEGTSGPPPGLPPLPILAQLRPNPPALPPHCRAISSSSSLSSLSSSTSQSSSPGSTPWNASGGGSISPRSIAFTCSTPHGGACWQVGRREAAGSCTPAQGQLQQAAQAAPPATAPPSPSSKANVHKQGHRQTGPTSQPGPTWSSRR